ncbi:hypothetical protein M9Y10_006462 [Tritrichomonas musculus]|uniref:Surface antigen BspA-like n=1 Tax=Tritrichomonas musculus TaxID=1915356 RepID=A0ABR2JE99_9EUKA
MFFSSLFFFFSLTSSRFDREEKIHTTRGNCPTGNTVTLDVENNKPFYYADCNGLTSVTINEKSLTTHNDEPNYIAPYLFYGSGLTTVTFGDLTGLRIGEGAFANTRINYLDFAKVIGIPSTGENVPDIPGYIYIKEGAFFNCTAIGSLRFPAIVNEIGNSAFEGCTSLNPTFDARTSPAAPLTYGEFAFYRCSTIGNLALPASGTIGRYAFANCQNLVINSQNQLTASRIEEGAFDGCKSVNLDLSCSSVGKWAFRAREEKIVSNFRTTFYISFDEYSFAGFTINCDISFKYSSNYPYGIKNHAFEGCILNGRSFTLTTVRVGSYAFKDCTGLTNCPLTLEYCTIGEKAFENVRNSFTLTLKNSNGDTSSNFLGPYAFYNSGVTGSLNIPRGTTINDNAFANCVSLTGSLLVDHSSIPAYAFQNCKFAGPIRIIGSDIGESAFECTTTPMTFSELIIGQQWTNVKDFQEAVEFFPPNTIKRRAFYGVIVSNDLIIHSSIYEIEEYAFATARLNTHSEIKVFSTIIHPYAFSQCQTNAPNGFDLNLHSAQIKFHAFDGCNINNLKIDAKDQVKFDYDDSHPIDIQIEEQAFYHLNIGTLKVSEEYKIGVSSFAQCTFGKSIEIKAIEIGRTAFADCTSSGCAITIGNTNIEERAFENFGTITSLVFNGEGSSSCTIGPYAFRGTSFNHANTFELVIPSYYTSVGNADSSVTSDLADGSVFAGITTLHPAKLIINCPTIGNRCFEGCTGITNFELNEGLSRIGSYAFHNTGLTGPLVLPKSLENINLGAFQGLKGLGQITTYTDSGLEGIGPYAFQGSSISGTLQIPQGVGIIYSYAFESCTSLTSLIFYYKSDLTQIGQNAFANCNGLNCYLDIPKSVTTIGRYAFANCTTLRGHVTIDLGSQVGPYAFIGCGQFDGSTGYGEVNPIPSPSPDPNTGNTIYIQKIRDEAFRGLDILTELTLPSTVQEIGKSSFEDCTNLRTLVLSSSLHYIRERAFANAGISGELKIPSNVIRIEDSAFENCTNLRQVTFDTSSLETIGRNAFRRAGLNETLVIPYSSKNNFRVGDYAFANTQLAGPIFLYGGTLGDYVFEGCTNLGQTLHDDDYDCDYSVRIDGGTVGPYNFESCRNFRGTILLIDGSIRKRAFEGVRTTQPMNLVIDEGISGSSIGDRAFYGSTLRGPLSIPSGVSIGEEAFSHCESINTPLYIATNLVGEGAFSYSSFSGSLTFNSRYITGFDQTTFQNATGFTSLVLKSLQEVPDRAFYEMSSLTGVLEFPSNAQVIGKYAFYGCGFTKVNFSKSIKSIEIREGGLSGLTNLNESIKFPELSAPTTRANDKAIPNYMFYRNLNLLSYVIDDDIIEIGDYAFYGCSNLRMDLDFTSITKIGISAFEGCTSLTGPLVIPTGLKTIGDNAFSGCRGLSGSLTINVEGRGSGSSSASQTIIGAGAFRGCEGFKKGTLSFFIVNNEVARTSSYSLYGADYFLRIGNEAFKDCKFDDIFYNGRFEPDCDYDIGIKHTKAIHTSSNYANKSFCSYPLHKDKLSGGAIAGICIAVIVVVAAIVVVIIYLIIRNKRNKDQSEAEVEMNADP